PVHETRDAAVAGAAAGALLFDANQTARRIRLAFEVADAELRAAEARFEQDAIGQRRRPRRLRDVQRAAEHADRFRRNASRLGQPWRRTRARAAERLLVPEHADLVARRGLPGQPQAGVLEGAIGVLETVRVRLI